MTKKINKLPTYEYLHECFVYNQYGGGLTWRKRPREHFKTDKGMRQFNDTYVGRIAGVQKKTDIRVIRLDGTNVQVRRVIWKMVYGEDPVGVVYNINGITGDYRIDNLGVKGWTPGVVNELPEGLEYDRERIMWGSRYIGWFRLKSQALEALGAI